MNITNPNQEIRERHNIQLPENGKREVWTEQDSEDVRVLRDAGHSIRKIASIMHCGTGHVQKAIKGKI
jgi:hypothetical protein